MLSKLSERSKWAFCRIAFLVRLGYTKSMQDLERFLTQITEQKWKRVNNTYYVSGDRLARIDVGHENLTLTIDNRPIYIGPAPNVGQVREQ